jgi:chemotaxis protein methyltransferase CheR
MHKLASSVAVLEHEVSELRLILERHAGVLLDATTEFLSERIVERVEASRLNSATELIGLLQTSTAECEALLEVLLDGETGFFRCPAAFEGLTKVALPEIEARKSRQTPRRLRIWSAGCL